MVDRFRVVPAAYVVMLRGDAEVLLQRRQDTGFMDGLWACGAAGHVEQGESVLEAAVREAAEELGITIAPEDLSPVTSLHRTGATGRAVDERVDWFFTCRRWQGEPALPEGKASDLAWHRLDALPGDVVPHERAVLSALHAGTLPAIWTFGFDPAEAAAQAAADAHVTRGSSR